MRPRPRRCTTLTSADCSITWCRCSQCAISPSRNYPQVNRDLLLTGAFLHDIGKIHELAYQRSISYTTKGQLLGHMIIELEMLHEKLAHIPGFPDELKILIEHLIISHHGQYEFGSPKLPMFPEALMLHYLDDLDSKMESMRAQFEREGRIGDRLDRLQPVAGASAAEYPKVPGERERQADPVKTEAVEEDFLAPWMAVRYPS